MQKSSFHNNIKFNWNTYPLPSKKSEISKPTLQNKYCDRKEKKLQKHTATKMPLGEFLQKYDDSSWSENEENDDFYLQCVQGKSQLSDLLQLEDMSEFPSLSLQENISQKCSKESTTRDEPYDDLTDFYECLNEVHRNESQKKLPKNTATKLSLGEFLQKCGDSSWSENVRNVDFYWNGIQSKSDLLQLENMSEFSSLSLRENISQKCSKESSSSNELFDNLGDIYECLNAVNKNASPEMYSLNQEEQQKESAVIIIENIPFGITAEDVETLLIEYGEITDLSLESLGICLKAKLKIDLAHDVDWMLECLNGSEPFGVGSSGVLKCYRC